MMPAPTTAPADRAVWDGRLPISNAKLALIVFLGAETMLFAGLISGYMVLRYATTTWPPPGQPYLPIAITWVNTLVLLVSGLTAQRAHRAVRQGRRRGLLGWLALTAALGALFLAIQGTEWLRLLAHGLTIARGNYGASFLLLIGLHGVHVLGALIWLLLVLGSALRSRFLANCAVPVDLCAWYWYFVCGLWVVLFKLVYLG
jgi:cytochrome c oxidase subunit 3